VEGSRNWKYFSGIFPEGLRRSIESHSQDSQSAARDSKPEIPSRLRRLVKYVLIRLQRKIISELSEISRSRFVSADQ
jgi:predicted AAA+ superfamily ATPase